MRDPSTSLPGSASILPPASWTFALVEERLIEAVTLWRRAPGGGASPFAKDAPWGQMRRINEAGDAFSFYDPRGFDMASSDVPLRPLPLVRAEHARMMEASAWIERYVPEADRRIVCMAVMMKSTGRRMDWRGLLHRLGINRGIEGVRKRYTRAVAVVAAGLTRDRVVIIPALTGA